MSVNENKGIVTPDPILQIASGFMAAKHLFIANEIGLFDALSDGAISLEDLAKRTEVPRRTVRILADAMVTLGVLERRADQYNHAPAAASFLSGSGPGDLRPLLRFWNHISYPAWLKFEEAVRSGQAPTRHGHFTPEEQRIFSAGVEAWSTDQAKALASTYDFGRHQRVLDVGGGTGSFLVAILRQHPHLRATLYELPTVVPVAQQRLASDPATSPVEVVGGDFFVDPLPEGHDAALVASVIHLFGPERNRAMLGRIRKAVQPGGRLLLVDLWTNATHTEPPAAALLAGEFLVIAGEGDVYSEEEARGWLSETCWRFVERTPLAGAVSLIVAEAL
jgi:ubiquinone/menaquinone biosynthesis C-methylase UbiE